MIQTPTEAAIAAEEETDRLADAGLELATERLARHPELAVRLLAKVAAGARSGSDR